MFTTGRNYSNELHRRSARHRDVRRNVQKKKKKNPLSVFSIRRRFLCSFPLASPEFILSVSTPLAATRLPDAIGRFTPPNDLVEGVIISQSSGSGRTSRLVEDRLTCGYDVPLWRSYAWQCDMAARFLFTASRGLFEKPLILYRSFYRIIFKNYFRTRVDHLY